MNIKPILFSTNMVQALLKGHKTVTRRVVKPQPVTEKAGPCKSPYGNSLHDGFELYKPPYQPDDILYVPEAWKCRFAMLDPDGLGYEVVFRDGKIFRFRFEDMERAKKWAKYARKNDNHWQSPYFMPKEAARIFLRVTGVRAERLQDIECIAKEGITLVPADNKRDPRFYFIDLWDSTIKPADRDKYGWAANPWVWVIEFERISRKEIT